MRLTLHIASLALFSLGISKTSAAEIWTVAADGTGQFTQIQSAIAAAKDGDVIRVLPGSYSSFSLTKAIMIVGEGAGLSLVEGGGECSIQGVATGSAGISRMGLSGTIKVASNQARILLQEASGQKLTISGSSSVLLEKWSGEQGVAMGVESLWLIDCSFQGGEGVPAILGPHGVWKQLPTPGSNAFHAGSSTLFVSNSNFTGGKGGAGLCSPSPKVIAGKSGGAGLSLSDDSTAWIAESVFSGGAGGSGQASATAGCADAEPGTGLKSGAQTKLHWDEKGEALFPLKILDASQGVVTMEFSGYPDDQILFILSTKPQTPGIDLQSYGVGGFPLGVDIGSGQVNYWFLDRTIYPDGKLVWKHLLPVDPALTGVPVFVQAFLYAPPTEPAHLPVLSAPTFWVIAEN